MIAPKHEWQITEMGQGYMLSINEYGLYYARTKKEIMQRFNGLVDDAIDLITKESAEDNNK